MNSPTAKTKRGRPAGSTTGRNGQPRQVYLDDGTWQALLALGDGNASEGVRRALATVSITPPDAPGR